MTEPKPEHKAGNEPPNLRKAQCCYNCKMASWLVDEWYDDYMSCDIYGIDVDPGYSVCDDYEPEE